MDYAGDFAQDQELDVQYLQLLGRELEQLELKKLRQNLSAAAYEEENDEISTRLLQWVDTYIPFEAEQAERAELEESSRYHRWEEVRERIRAILHLNGMVPALIFLDQLVGQLGQRAELGAIQAAYEDWADLLSSEAGNEGAIWQYDLRRLQTRLEDLLNELNEEDLRKSWSLHFHQLTTVFGDSSEQYRDEVVFALVSRVERILIPTTIAGEEQQQAFKRAMYRLQDLYHAGQFGEAYQQALQIRDELECESSQLYEYLLLSFFRKEGPKAIIDRAITQADYEPLRHLYVYASRLQRLQWPAELPEDATSHPAYAFHGKGMASDTAVHNLRQIANGLLLRLAERYSLLVSQHDSAAARLALQRGMWLTGLIGQYVAGDALFAPLVVTELAGGGLQETQWVKVEGGELRNVYPDFDALSLLRSARRVLRLELLPSPNRPEASLVADLRYSLEDRYASVQLDQQLDRSSAVIVHKLKEILRSGYVMSLLFPDYTELADLPIRELATKEGLLEWFSLDDQGKLSTQADDPGLQGFPAYAYLAHFVQWRDGPAAWQRLESELRELVYYRLAHRAQQAYDKINSSHYAISDLNRTYVETVMDCLRDWLKCYRTYGDERFWEACYHELTGDGHFFWFSVTSAGISDPLYLREFNWSSLRFLRLLLSLRTTKEPLEAQTEIGLNYLRFFIDKRYREIQQITENQLNPGIAYRQEIYNLMEHVLVLCEKVVPLDEFLAFIYDELVLEQILPWLDIEGDSLADYPSERYHPLMAVDLLRRVQRVLVDESENWTDEAVFQEVLAHRYRDARYDYQFEFSPLRYRNYHLEDRMLMVELLNRCLHFYQLTDDPKYLELPYREYVLNRGRFRWGYYVRPFRQGRAQELVAPALIFEHWHNWRVDGLHYNRQRKYVKKEWHRHYAAGHVFDDGLLHLD
ncbi:MAG: hypothetical protein AAF433_06575 [Bacteroidota bacterium]